jgi:hypothetical protein
MCACRGGTTASARAMHAGSGVRYQVTKNGQSTGRFFTTMVSATRYANSIQGGKVETL